MKYIRRFNENLSIEDKIYTEIENDYNKEVADSIDYDVLNLLSTIPTIDHWTVESKIDESKIDGSEEWLEYFEDDYSVIIYSKPGFNKRMKDSELVENVNLSDYIKRRVYYTAQSSSDRNIRKNLKNYLSSKINGIVFLKQEDTPYDVDLVISFIVPLK